jgi:AraC-like DNA-binding protein
VGWVLYDASLIFVLQGAKLGRLGDRSLHYAEGSHLVLPLSVPLQSTIQAATPDRPFLAITIAIDPREIASLVFGGVTGLDDTPLPAPLAVGHTTEAMEDALMRLLQSMDSEPDRRILVPAIIREIHYRVLSGPNGALLHAAARETGTIAQVAAALRLIHERYDRALSVADMASAAHMAESTFFGAFRSITGTTPIQHLKDVRLNRARQLLAFEGASVAEAARRTGYRSRSHFSRDFTERFGMSPSAAR